MKRRTVNEEALRGEGWVVATPHPSEWVNELVAGELRRLIRKMRGRFGKTGFPELIVHWSGRLTWAAGNASGKQIKLSIPLLRQREWILNTLRHEVAHFIVFNLWKKGEFEKRPRAHGKEWRAIYRELGGEGEIYHTYHSELQMEWYRGGEIMERPPSLEGFLYELGYTFEDLNYVNTAERGDFIVWAEWNEGRGIEGDKGWRKIMGMVWDITVEGLFKIKVEKSAGASPYKPGRVLMRSPRRIDGEDRGAKIVGLKRKN